MTGEKSYPLHDAIESYLTNLKVEGRSPHTLGWYEDIFNCFSRWCARLDGIPSDSNPDSDGNNCSLDEVTSDLVRKYFLYLQEEHRNPQTKQAGLSKSSRAGHYRALYAPKGAAYV